MPVEAGFYKKKLALFIFAFTCTLLVGCQGSAPSAPREPIGDDEVTRLMNELLTAQADDVDAILDEMVASGDQRFVAVMLELLRGRQIGLGSGNFRQYRVALEALSGQQLGDDWPAWVEWYGRSDLEPPPGFTGWKGQLLSLIDPEFATFLQDRYPSRIRVEEIVWGGVRVDGIPPLERPPAVPGSEADYLLDDEPVFGLVVNGEARAYPLRIIDNHEMANDVLGGVPLSLSYCTLCGAAIAYDGRASDGNIYSFGTSGFLYRSNKLMYDRQTRSLWNQLTGRPVLGPLADSDLALEILPLVVTNWADWLEQHPDSQVLDNETGLYPADFYEPGVLYGDYFASSETMFPVWQRSDLLADKEFVYTLRLDGVPKAYQVDALVEEEVVNDRVGDTNVVLVAVRGITQVNGFNRRVGRVTYSNGAEVRAFGRGDHTFSPGPEPDTLLDDKGDLWRVSEEGLTGSGDRRYPRLDGHLAYWFGWYAFFPDTQLYPEP